MPKRSIYAQIDAVNAVLKRTRRDAERRRGHDNYGEAHEHVLRLECALKTLHWVRDHKAILREIAGRKSANAINASALDPRTFAFDRVKMPNAAGYIVRHAPMPDYFPYSLFQERSLKDGAIAIFPNTKTAESLNVNLPISQTELQAAESAGARIQDSTAFINLLEVEEIPTELELYLPLFVKKQIRPLMFDMIPETSFGASLANILSRPSWDALRFEATARSGGCCQICGDKPKSIECHELWEYHLPGRWGDNPVARGVQTLVALLALCRDCHRMFHPGRAEAHGYADEVWGRIAWINRWNVEELNSYSCTIQKMWQQRSEIRWDLDLRLVREWELVVQQSKLTLLPGGRLQNIRTGSITGLLGVTWRFSEETEFHPSVDVPDWLKVETGLSHSAHSGQSGH